MSVIDEILKRLKGANQAERSQFMREVIADKALFDALRKAGIEHYGETLTAQDGQERAIERPFGGLSTVQKIDLIDKVSEIELIDIIALISTINTVSQVTNIANLQSVDLIDLITRVGLIDTITEVTTLKTIEDINQITNIDTISLIKAINKVDDAIISDFTKVATRKPFSVSPSAAGDSPIWTPATGYKIRLKGWHFDISADVEVGLRFGVTESAWAKSYTKGRNHFNLLGCNFEGTTDQAINLRAEGAVTAKGVLMGEEIKVLTLTLATVRPTSDYSLQWYYPTSGTHYTEVDEETADNETTRIATSPAPSSLVRDRFGFTHSIPSGAKIYYVKLYFKARNEDATYGGNVSALLDVNGQLFYGTLQKPPLAYTLYSYEWTKNPLTGLEWTYADLATLRIGVRGNSGSFEGSYYPLRVTQVYAEIQYGA